MTTIALDPLIAEAKQRARRRRWLVLGLVVVAAAAVGTPLATRSSPRTSPRFGLGAALRDRVQVRTVGSSGGVTWAMNGRGIWLTTDGGRTWRASTPANLRGRQDLSDSVQQVEFLDARHGWVIGAAVDRTSDGGRTWSRSVPYTGTCCGYASFVTARRGFLTGGSGLYATTDGGATWRPFGLIGPSWGLPTFLSARRAVALGLGKSDTVFRTVDGGRRWKAVPLGDLTAQAVLLPSLVGFGNSLVAVGERVVPAALVAYVSGDGGRSWAARPLPRWWTPVIANHDEQRFSAATATTWFAAARRSIVETSDAGRTWNRVPIADLPPRWQITAIDFMTPRVGWAVFSITDRSVLARTTDGGRHWTPAGPPKPKAHNRT